MYVLTERREQPTSHILRRGFGKRVHEIRPQFKKPLPVFSEAAPKTNFLVSPIENEMNVRLFKQAIACGKFFTIGQMAEIIRLAEQEMAKLLNELENIPFAKREEHFFSMEKVTEYFLAVTLLAQDVHCHCVTMKYITYGFEPSHVTGLSSGFYIPLKIHGKIVTAFCGKEKNSTNTFDLLEFEDVKQHHNTYLVWPE